MKAKTDKKGGKRREIKFVLAKGGLEEKLKLWRGQKGEKVNTLHQRLKSGGGGGYSR